MPETEVLQESKRENAGISPADLLLAIPASLGSGALSSALTKLSRALQLLATPCQTVLALPDPTSHGQVSGSPSAQFTEQPTDLPAATPETPSLRYLNYSLPSFDPNTSPWLTNAITYETLLSLAGKLSVRACTVLGTDPEFSRESLTAERLTLLMEPGVEGSFDLVMPLYTMQAFDDLLNKSILYPLTRALYGHRIRYPLANEFQVSSKLLPKLPSYSAKDSVRQQGRLLWLASTAANQNLKICQVRLGARHPQSHEGIELSDALAQLAGPLFTDMEDNAAFWQRIRGSHEVPTFGSSEIPTEAADTVDVRRRVDAFQLGVRNLRDIWSLILPPNTLLELHKLSRLTPEEFHMPDVLWVRIIYDFALAYRLRNIHRAHLFGALTPLYLGWVASYAVEVNTTGMATAEGRVEQLARTYEAEKPYLLSRWRWPDRFHP